MDEYIFQLAFPKTSRATTESKLKQKEGKAPPKEIAHVKSNCSSTPLSMQFINYTNRVSPTSLPESMKVTKPKEGDPLYKLFQTFKRQQSSLSTSDEESTDNTRGNTTDTTTLHKSTVVLLFSWSKYFRGHFI